MKIKTNYTIDILNYSVNIYVIKIDESEQELLIEYDDKSINVIINYDEKYVTKNYIEKLINKYYNQLLNIVRDKTKVKLEIIYNDDYSFNDYYVHECIVKDSNDNTINIVNFKEDEIVDFVNSFRKKYYNNIYEIIFNLDNVKKMTSKELSKINYIYNYLIKRGD